MQDNEKEATKVEEKVEGHEDLSHHHKGGTQNDQIVGKNSAIVSISIKRNSSTYAIMGRVQSKWPRLVLHPLWKTYMH